MNVYKYLKERCNEDGSRFVSVVPSARTRCRGPKLEHRRFLLNFRKQLFPVKVSDHLDRLPREVVVFILGDSQNKS